MNDPAATHPDPLVWVIVLNWNGWRDTLACARSLRESKYQRAHVVVVDNGSTDDSTTQLRRAMPDLHLIETGANLGFAAGNNVGLREALRQGAAMVWLLNNDTTVDPDALAELVRTMLRDPHAGAVQSVLYRMDEPTTVQAAGGRVNLWTGMHRHVVRVSPGAAPDYGVGASLLLRREALDRTGLLDEGFFLTWEDTDLGLRMRRAGWTVALAERSKVWHKVSASTGRGSATLDEHYFHSATRFLRRHAPLPCVPIGLRLAGALAVRLARLRFARCAAVWRGVRRGWTQPLTLADTEAAAR